jgi:hypothetical protein
MPEVNPALGSVQPDFPRRLAGHVWHDAQTVSIHVRADSLQTMIGEQPLVWFLKRSSRKRKPVKTNSLFRWKKHWYKQAPLQIGLLV